MYMKSKIETAKYEASP